MTDALPSLAGVKVLIVDDDEAARYAWARYLTRAGAVVTAAGGAKQALHALETTSIDVLVTDIVLPDLDGFQLVTGARSFPGRIVLIAVTAFDDEQQRARAQRVAVDLYLVKPVDASRLVREIAQRIGSRS